MTLPDVETVRLAYDVTGAGPLLVLLHGITENRHAWDPVLPGLAADFRVVRVDLRGHGESPHAEAYAQPEYAADVAELVGAVGGGEAPLVVGHSLGGLIASVYGARYPVRGVIDVDQSLDLAPLQGAAKQLEPQLREGDVVSAMGSVFAAMRGGLPDAEDERLRALRRPERDVVLGTWSLMLDEDADALAAYIDALLDGLDVPYLALFGVAPPDGYAEWLRRRVPDPEIEVWDGAGHHPHLTDPERFLDRVRRFADEHPAVAADTI